jgi:uncharacterized protein (TIGR02246 family)
MPRIFLSLFLGLICLPLAAQPAPPPDDSAAIQIVMRDQVAAWNHADIPAFMACYENSPETTFVGSSVNKGWQPILEHYQKAYTSADQMGTLTYTNLEIRLLPAANGTVEFATVTGRFHLQRTAKGSAKQDDGIFSLLWRKCPQGWKIVLDHTS